jgi:hypothetical protein
MRESARSKLVDGRWTMSQFLQDVKLRARYAKRLLSVPA